MSVAWVIQIGGFLFASSRLNVLIKKFKEVQKILEYLSISNALSPQLVIKALQNGSSPEILLNFLDYEEGQNYAKGIALIQGIVESDQVIRSVLNHSTRLVLSSVSSEQIFSNNKNFEETAGRIDTKFVSEFRMVDPTSQKDQVLINTTSSAKYSGALNLVHSIVHIRRLSTIEKIMSWLLFCIKLFLSVSSVGKRLSGFKVGTKKIERGILVGQYLYAFGEVVLDKFNHELRMTNPQYLLADKEQLISRLTKKSRKLQKSMVLMFLLEAILSTMLAGALLKLGKKALANFYEYRSRISNGLEDRFPSLKYLFIKSFICSICKKEASNVILKPCLHLNMCSTCYQNLPAKRCQQCRTSIEDVVRVFVA